MTFTRNTLISLLVVMTAAAIALAGAACGSSGATETADQSSSASTAGTQLFDDSQIHTISVVFDQEDYDDMIATYKDSSDKEWIEATVTIDGATYEQVGMRLKGNSSLRGLANGRETGTGGPVSADDPQGLPWLIRLDKYVDGQNCDGITDLVIRSNNWETSLNEAVALELLDAAGLASERSIYVRFTVNDGDTALRLAVELPEDIWMAEHFSADGALYKAEATGNYNYRGTDSEAYDEIFDQEAGEDNADLTPLIEFLDFINNSDDDTFAGELADWLDIDELVTYLAMQELIANSDDIDGPGNNSYLYYDPASDLFTVVAWDHNLAFGGMGEGGLAGDRPARADLGTLPAGATAPGQIPGTANPGAVNPDGVDPREGIPGVAPDTGDRNFRDKVNILTQRFHADTDFEAQYQERLAELRAELYESGTAADILTHWTDLLRSQASDLIDAATVDEEAAKISAYWGES